MNSKGSTHWLEMLMLQGALTRVFPSSDPPHDELGISPARLILRSAFARDGRDRKDQPATRPSPIRTERKNLPARFRRDRRNAFTTSLSVPLGKGARTAGDGLRGTSPKYLATGEAEVSAIVTTL